MPCLLIIEDDRAIALGLRLNLRKDGHEVRLAQDGETGLRMALESEVDLIVLDIMLPGRNGYEVLKDLRRQGSSASVLMLTAKGMEGDKILGLKLGAGVRGHAAYRGQFRPIAAGQAGGERGGAAPLPHRARSRVQVREVIP